VKFELKQRDRRALILLALGLGVFVLADMVALPAYDRISAGRDSADQKEKELRRYRRAEQRKGQYANLLKLASERVVKSEAVVISAASVSLASSELQAMIEGVGAKVGVMMGQRTIGRPRRLNNFYAELPMTLSFESTPGQLTAFLNELRSLPRFVNARALQVSPAQMVFEAPKGGDLQKNVRVGMTVAALISADLVKEGATK
jgi:Tfp pilus assembly protein PilO